MFSILKYNYITNIGSLNFNFFHFKSAVDTKTSAVHDPSFNSQEEMSKMIQLVVRKKEPKNPKHDIQSKPLEREAISVPTKRTESA